MGALARIAGIGAAMAAVLALTAWVYAPGLGGGYVLDDAGSVQHLAVVREDPDMFRELVSGDTSGMLGRVLPVLTFVAEQAYTAGTATVSKTNNLLLHLLNGVLLFFLARGLLCYRCPREATFGAAVAAAIWLLSPLQVSTVLYVVQRMAMLATTLVLVALLAYVTARARLSAGKRPWLSLPLALVAILAAPYAKETGFLALPLMVVLECCWFWPAQKRGHWRARVAPLLPLLALGGVAGLYLMFHEGYALRRFDLAERLLTESRILIDYVRQFFWADTLRLGVYHDDVPVSRGLLQPPATAASVLLWSALLGASIAAAWRGVGMPWVALLWAFLGAHSIESTVLPLELYFEHRNYLPGVFLAIAAGLAALRLRALLQGRGAGLAALIALYLLALAMKTTAVSYAWGDPLRLAVHQLAGHPGSSRAHAEIAKQYALLGDYPRAAAAAAQADVFEARSPATRVRRSADQRLRNVALACLARAALPEGELAAIAASPLERPIGETHYVAELKRMRQLGTCPDFAWETLGDSFAELYLGESPRARASANVYEVLASFANTGGQLERARAYMALAVDARPGDWELLLMRAYFERVTGDDEAARGTLSRLEDLARAGELTPRQIERLNSFKES
mgnify:CR=1 FL=1